MSMKTNFVADNGIEYRLVGDGYLPNMMLPEESRSIGFWGRLRRDYQKDTIPFPVMVKSSATSSGRTSFKVQSLQKQIIQRMQEPEGSCLAGL